MFSTKYRNGRESASKPRRNRNPESLPRQGREKIAEAVSTISEISGEAGPMEADLRSWNDIVFENRNREYGAYVVRKSYNGNLVTGLIITILFVTAILLYPALSRWIGGSESVPKIQPRKLVYTELSPPPPIDKPRPAPPNIVLPRLQKVIKFVPPRVVREQVIESAPTLSEIKENVTGNQESEGPTQVVFDEPVPEGVSDGAGDEIFTVVDQQPEYAGGYDAMIAFIKKNMVYPPNARRMQIEGTVHVSFVVSKTGEISDVKVLRGIFGECDREAVRVVQIMPKWNPGKQNGHPVNVRFIMPLKFRLN